MTANKRIFLNVIATYGRSLYALVCGLFSARWVLGALGQENLGLYGVIGGMTIFISFINNLLSVSLSRYYSVCVGAANVSENKSSGIFECQKWFSSAVLIHTVIPLLLMAIGYPVGEYAIRNGWIVVPVDRIDTCIWVFRYTCIACFIGMSSVPYSAMYAAKQYIAELTLYSFATVTANMFFFYYMVSHTGDWLSRYAAWMAVVSVLPNVVISIRALCIFPECRLVPREMFSRSRIGQLASFAGWQAFGGLGNMLRMQGMAILLNRCVEFGSMRNSSMSVAHQIAAQSDMLSGAMLGAFQPAIANAYGARDLARLKSLAFCCCKIGTLLSMVFALPLALELPTVLALWLKEPPVYAVGLCWSILAAHIIDRSSAGHMLAVTAVGRIAAYQAFLGSALIMALPLAWFMLWLQLGIYSVGWALLVSTILCAWGRVWFARPVAGMSARYWFSHVLSPLAILAGLVLGFGCIPSALMPPSVIRVVVTTLICEIVLFACAWKFLLDFSEKEYLRARLSRLLPWFVKRS